MGVTDIVGQLDQEIAQLKQARALLSGMWSRSSGKRASLGPTAAAKSKKRNLTPEGRRRIAEAVRRRWARQKGQSARTS